MEFSSGGVALNRGFVSVMNPTYQYDIEGPLLVRAIRTKLLVSFNTKSLGASKGVENKERGCVPHLPFVVHAEEYGFREFSKL
eukprot:484970-Pyramimonas_sp.AAC.3